MDNSINKYITKKYNRNKYAYLLLSFNSGIATITELAVNYYFKDKLKINPAFLSQINAIIKIPFMIKPLFGLITDFFPIFGFRRKFYIIISAILNSMSWFIFANFKLDWIQSTICLFIINATMGFSTVLSQAIFVELDKLSVEYNLTEDAKDLANNYVIVKNLGMIIAAFLKGYLLEIFSIESMFMISGINQIMMFISGIILVEEKKNFIKNNKEETDNEHLLETYEENENENKTVSFKQFLNYIFQKKIIFPFIFIVILILFSSPSLNDTMFYYCSNCLKFTPNEFGIIHSWTLILNLLIIIIHKKIISKKLTFKQIIFLAKILLFIFTIPNYFLVKNLTKNYINDFILITITNSSAFIFNTLTYLPVFDLAAKLSPKQLEGTVYSVFMSSINLGGNFSILLGGILTKFYKITRLNFENMDKFILTINFLFLLPLPILLLIPNIF
jgi:Na+/melibiose symporter-like transporter